ncbi:hypothetical protein SHELI_v1c05900 [Spiroplasma helicoides]|uniref:Uncharacterized protein n=1 Tax=Spiroplasma helicoides TaxID=216938 RepID=A0A1B3SKT4_9MOLU|nr:hypothetical protein [Spiroplasma helicoides]AOG60541.1 hypothetical protein SHELI_v1c05900 [Spiroplasma helicoides]
MGNYALLQDFIDIISQQWFRKFFNDKLDELKNGLMEGTNDTFRTEFIPDIELMNQTLVSLKKQAEQLLTMKEITEFIDKNSLKQRSKDNKIANIALDEELINSIKENPDKVAEKITELIIKMQIGNILKSSSKAFSMIDSLLNKLGKDTIFSDIDREDVYYILQTEILKSVDKLKEWSINNSKMSKNFEEELIILMSNSKFSIKEDAIEIITHYFDNVINNELTESEIAVMSKPEGKEAAKIINYNKGVVICEELTAKIQLSIIIEKLLEN